MRNVLYLLVTILCFSTPAVYAAGGVTVAIPDNVTSLDPADTNDVPSQSALRLMFQGLYGFDKEMKLVPTLAEKYEANSDATEHTFYLRQGVKFHDGEPFNASAAKASLERLANPENKLKRQSLLSMLERIDIIDDYTIRLKLKSPFGALVNNLAHPGAMILSPKAIEKFGREISRHPVGTGPFEFVSWTPDEVKVKKNNNYWKEGLPHVDSISYRSVPENGTRIAMLRTGEADFIYPMPTEMIKVVERDPNIEVMRSPSIAVRYIAMNLATKPFNDIRVREAMNYAIDKKALIRVVYDGFAQPLDSPLPPTLNYYAKQGEWPYDPKKAKELLATAGYENGFETELWGVNNTLATRAMQFLQQQLAQVGVKVSVRPLEAGVLYSDLLTSAAPKDAKLKMYFGGWSSSTGDADWALRPLFSSKGFPPTLYNVGYYSDPAVDSDIEQAMATADPEKKANLYGKAQSRVWKAAPWVFLAVDEMLSAHRKSLTGAARIPDGGLLLEEIDRR